MAGKSVTGTVQPSQQKERRGLVKREDHEPNLAGALKGTVGTPSDTNRFVTEQGLDDAGDSVLSRLILTVEGGVVYDAAGELVLKAAV